MRFERLLERVARARGARRCGAATPLADLADEPFAAAEIRRLDELRLRAAETRDRRRPRGGPARRGDRRARRARRGEPAARAPARAAHARALPRRAGSRRRSRPTATRARCSWRRSASSPAPSCSELHERILAQDPALDLPRAPAAEPARRSAAARGRRLLVGRRRPAARRHARRSASSACSSRRAAGHRRELRRADRPRRRAHHEADPRRQRPERGDGRRRLGVDRQRGRRHRLAHRPRARRGGADPGRRRARGASRSAAGRCGWPTATSRDVAQVDPGRQQGRPADRGRQRAARAGGRGGRAVGRVRASTGASGAIDLGRGRVDAADPGRREPVARSRPAPARCGWRARRRARSTRHRPAQRQRRAADHASATGRARWRSARARSGSSTATTGRSRGIDPDDQHGVLDGRGRQRPDRRRRGRGLRLGRRRRGRAPSSVSTRTARASSRGFETGSRPAAIAVAGGSVWAAADAPQSAHRGGTLRVLVQHAPGGAGPDGLAAPAGLHHAGRRSSSARWRTTGSSPTGASTAPRAPRSSARSPPTAPAPSADGRTYVFTLRPGLRYSDGRPVRPTDFRASMERFLVARATAAGNSSSRRSTRASSAPRSACAADGSLRPRRAGSRPTRGRGPITIHLSRPDADFLHKLTIPFAFVVPADSPRRATTGAAASGHRAVPRRRVGLRIAAGRSSATRTSGRAPARPRGGGLRRPHRGRLVPDEPDRAADRRRAARRRRRRRSSRIRSAARSAQRRLRALVAASPGRWTAARRRCPTGSSSTCGAARSTTSRVRQAVNFAIDRATRRRARGRPRGRPARLPVPAGRLPRPRAVLPVHRQAGAGRRWTRTRHGARAPARRGVRPGRASTSSSACRTSESAARALLRAAARRSRIPHDAADAPSGTSATSTGPGTRAQTGLVGWGADYVAASTFFETALSCAARARTTSPGSAIARSTARSLARSPRRRRTACRVGRADRRVSDLAAAVPLTSRRSAVLVSERVGNVRTHGSWFTLLDQMWVR